MQRFNFRSDPRVPWKPLSFFFFYVLDLNNVFLKDLTGIGTVINLHVLIGPHRELDNVIRHMFGQLEIFNPGLGHVSLQPLKLWRQILEAILNFFFCSIKTGV